MFFSFSGTGLAAVFINISVENFAGWKYSLTFKIIQTSYFAGCLVYIFFNLALVLSSVYIVTKFAPAAAGSGIPEIKGYLNGKFIHFELYLLSLAKVFFFFPSSCGVIYFDRFQIFGKSAGIDTHGILLFRTLIGKVCYYTYSWYLYWPHECGLLKVITCSFLLDIWKHRFSWWWSSPWKRRSTCTYWCLHCFFAWTSKYCNEDVLLNSKVHVFLL